MQENEPMMDEYALIKIDYEQIRHAGAQEVYFAAILMLCFNK